MINNINIVYDNKESIIKSSEDLAKELFNQVLCVGDAMYMLMDFEFYIKTKNTDVFKDEYVYSGEQQLKKGYLFSHDSGFDITWGNEELYVGILIRSLAKLYDKNTPHPDISFSKTFKIQQYIMGPHAVADEIIKQFNVLNQSSIRFEEKHYIGMEGFMKFPHTSSTKRVGLVEKDFADSEYFRALNFRHIAFLPNTVMKNICPNSNVKDITNIIINDYQKQKITDKELVKNILGYTPTVLK